MRRLVSIAMVLLFWVGPLSALMPRSDESQLPACCRRHGPHHCTMAAAAEQGADAGRLLTAPSHCPQYHRALPATMGAFTLPGNSPAARPAGTEPILACAQPAALHLARTISSRGPPSHL
jgi:hypothetical protein